MRKLESASLAARAMARLRLVTILGGAALLLLSGATARAAITPSNVDPWQHIVDCAAALLSNPAEHAQFCSPGHAEALTFHSSFMWTPVNPPAPPPPPPPSSSEECVECD